MMILFMVFFSKSDDIGFDAETYRLDSFLKQMVLFSVSMKVQHFIPASTVNLIVTEIKTILSCYCAQAINILLTIMKSNNLPENTISCILLPLKQKDHLQLIKLFIDDELCSSYAHELYFIKNFNFVASLKKYLHIAEDVTETVLF